MIEPRAGVFVGVMSGLVRDKLWEKVEDESGEEGAATLITSGKTEQGFHVRCHGDPTRQMVDVDGLMLVRIPQRSTGQARRNQEGRAAGEGRIDPANE